MCETKLGPNIATSEFLSPDIGYRTFRKDNKQGQGGVLICVKDTPNLSCETIETGQGEILWVKISIENHKNIYAGSFYRRPGTKLDQLEYLDQSLNVLDNLIKNNANNTVILGGDFNARAIDWDSCSVLPLSTQKAVDERLLEVLASHNLSQHQREPTRLDSVLDLFCTNSPGLVKTMHTIPGISDHDIPVADCAMRAIPNSKSPYKRYKFNKADWDAIKTHFVTFRTDFLSQYLSNTVEENWSSFKSTLLDLMNRFVPCMTTKRRQNLPWWNRHLQKLVRRKQRLYNKAKKKQEPTAWSKYRSSQKALHIAIRQARWDYVNTILLEGMQNDNNKPFWRYVKTQKKDNTGVAPLKRDGTLYSDNTSKAEILNSQFQSVFTQEGDDPLPIPGDPSCPTMSPFTISQPGVEKLLRSLNARKAAGPDDLPCHVLREMASEIAPVLTVIFNQSLSSGELPEDWLKANVAPIFKKGNINLPENYRPVSLTSVCCKILEHIILRQMLDHFDTHSILTSLQHGFRAARSCATQLIITINDLLNYFDQGTQVDVIVLDFSKAFDTVPHDRLLHKLSNYGIRNNLLKWISSFLKSRSQRVVVDGANSAWVHVDSGVPQGTVLGPLLFLAHINDLPRVIQSSCRLFADDCLLYRAIHGPRDQQILQDDLTKLQAWASDWGMRFNASKCQVLRTYRTRHPVSCFYAINHHILEEVNAATYLGVTITSKLDWGQHIDSMCNRANRTLGFLRRNLSHAPKDLKCLAYISLVRSVLEYAAQAWDPHLKKHVDQLERIQRRAARFATRDYSTYSSVTSMLDDLKWDSLAQRRRHLRLTLMFKITHQLVFVPTEGVLLPADSRTRASHHLKFRQMQTRTSAHSNSFFPRTIKDWNALPSDAVSATSADMFQAWLRTNRC